MKSQRRRRLLARTPPPPAVFSLAVLALPHPPPQLTERLDGWGESEKKIRFKSVKSDTNITYATIIAGWSDSWLAPKVLGGNWSDFILFYFNICKCKLVTRGFKDAIFFLSFQLSVLFNFVFITVFLFLVVWHLIFDILNNQVNGMSTISTLPRLFLAQKRRNLNDAIMTGGCIQMSFRNQKVFRRRRLPRGLNNMIKKTRTTFQ